jgi:hypothetical protein
MIKFAVAAIWISAVTVASVMFAFNGAGEGEGGEDTPSVFGGLEYVTTDVISVPVLQDRRVQGYFLARLVYTAEARKLSRMAIQPEAMILDEVYSYLFANPQIDFSVVDTVDLEAFRAGIRDSINRRVGEQLIHDVLVEQMDYLSKADIRNNTMRSWTEDDR